MIYVYISANIIHSLMDVGIMEARKLFCTQQLFYFLISYPGAKKLKNIKKKTGLSRKTFTS